MDGSNNGGAVLPSGSCKAVILFSAERNFALKLILFFSCFLLDFDLQCQFGGSGGLPNFDYCGRNPPPCNPSHLSLCLKSCGRPYISPLHHHSLILTLFIYLFYFFFFISRLFTSPIHLPPRGGRLLLSAEMDIREAEKRDAGFRASRFSLKLQEAWHCCH